MLKYIFVLFFIVSGFTLAQEIEVPEPCTPDCSAQEWSPVQITPMKDCCRGNFVIY